MEEAMEVPGWKTASARRLEERGVPQTEVQDHNSEDDLPPLLLERASLVEKALRQYLSRVDERLPEDVHLPTKIVDRLRLINLYTWSVHYRIELSFILDTLLQKRFVGIRQPNGGLGVSVAALCSRGSRKFLEEILTESPEHQRPVLVRNLMPICNGTHPSSASMIRYYAETMRERHQEAEKTKALILASPRNWRDKNG